MFQNGRRSHKSWLQKIKKLVLLFFLLLTIPANAAQVLSCSDGDTCWIQDSGSKFKVRFYGIDAPESDQPYGQEAREYLNNLVSNKEVDLKCKGNSFDRKTCDLYLNGQDVSALLVKEGYAWDYPKFSHGQYQGLQKDAQQAHLGMWKDTNITSPYCWRWTGTTECKNVLYEP
jgi:micrococcal nuclease